MVSNSWQGGPAFITAHVTEISGFPTEEVDPTGAGDAFSGTFLAVYMRSGDPVSLPEANAAAAAHVKALGPMESGSPPRLYEIGEPKSTE